MKPDKGMSRIVKTVTCWVNSFIFLFGLYIMLFGHITPGGGFPGGVIISCSFILITLAAGKDFSLKLLSLQDTTVVDSLCVFFFLLLGFLGIFYGGYFFNNFLPGGTPFRLASSGTIVLSNVLIGLKVGAAIFAMFMHLSLFRIEETAEE